ncbi:MAG: response regulator transcription factor [Flavobacteriales bacterium]|nr:response regulator transcription factor [Flavobacteriales bacterium]
MRLLSASKQVIVIDNNPISRAHTVNNLKRSNIFLSILEVANGIEALIELKKESPCMVITEIHMPRMGGLELIRFVKNKNPFIKIIVLTKCRNKIEIRDILATGANAFICKEESKKNILTAVKKVLNGTRYISPRAIEVYNLNAPIILKEYNLKTTLL